MTVTFWEAAVQAVTAGQRVWLITVAAVQGSAPQRPGAMMAVGPAGRLAGTIGGGAVEYDCVQKVIRGEALPGDCRGWGLLAVDGLPLGWVKGSGGVLKNHYPKGLRRP